jgi:hypothetical protein
MPAAQDYSPFGVNATPWWASPVYRPARQVQQARHNDAARSTASKDLDPYSDTVATAAAIAIANPELIPMFQQIGRYGTNSVASVLGQGTGMKLNPRRLDETDWEKWAPGVEDAVIGKQSLPQQLGAYYGAAPRYNSLRENESMGTAYKNEAIEGFSSEGLRQSMGTSALNFINPARAIGRRQASKRLGREQADAENQARSAFEAARKAGIAQWAGQIGNDFIESAGGIESLQNMGDEMLNQRAQQFAVQKARNRMVGAVDSYFLDPTRQMRQNQMVHDQQAAAIKAAQDQTREASRANAFTQASRGLTGGSADYSGQGRVQRASDAAAYAIGNQASLLKSQMKQEDAAKRGELRNLIYSDDPAAGEAFRYQLGMLRAQGDQSQDQAQVQNQFSQLRQAGQQAFSQSLGSMFTNLGKGAQSYYLASSGG